MWSYSTTQRYVEWKHLMRMFVPSAKVNPLSKQKYVLWKEVSHYFFGEGLGVCMGRTKGVRTWAYVHVVVPNDVCRGHFGLIFWLPKQIIAMNLADNQLAYIKGCKKLVEAYKTFCNINATRNFSNMLFIYHEVLHIENARRWWLVGPHQQGQGICG